MTMHPSLRLTMAASSIILASASTLGAQTSAPSAGSQPTIRAESDTSRPATTTFFGDTGLWFVPTGEVLADGQWSVSGYRRGTNWMQGYSNVADFAATFGVGIKNRAEIFGSFLVDTRIDRDVRPIFVADLTFGGVLAGYPRVNTPWTGNRIGDFYVGAKINLLSERQNRPAAFAIRGIVKLPTGDADQGVSTGKTDFAIDAIVSKEIARASEVSAYGGYEWRGKPDGFDTPGGAFRWGGGIAFPSRSMVRITGELNGVVPSSDSVTIAGPALLATDQSVAPLLSSVENLTRATVGLTLQSRKGFFVGAGVSWTMPTQARNTAFSENGTDVTGDYFDWQVRIGWHPGVRTYVTAAALPSPGPQEASAPSTPVSPSPENRPPTVSAQCDPCSVEIGKSVTLTAVARDPDGDTLAYRWSSPSGSLAASADQSTQWTAPDQEGVVAIMVTVSDGHGGIASATVNVQVTRPSGRSYSFEDVHFDFDRYSLRPDAVTILDQAVAAMSQDAALRLTIEGHTCSIGTAEYNLALGHRRANSVRDYLINRGVSPERLNVISYGEERPKYDNSREETRRLNRRAVLVVRLQ